jgi:hypothetical protein
MLFSVRKPGSNSLGETPNSWRDIGLAKENAAVDSESARQGNTLLPWYPVAVASPYGAVE